MSNMIVSSRRGEMSFFTGVEFNKISIYVVILSSD